MGFQKAMRSRRRGAVGDVCRGGWRASLRQSALIVRRVVFGGVTVRAFATHECDQRMLILRRLLFPPLFIWTQGINSCFLFLVLFFFFFFAFFILFCWFYFLCIYDPRLQTRLPQIFHFSHERFSPPVCCRFNDLFIHLVPALSVSPIRLYFMKDTSGISAPEKPVSDL